MSKLIAKEIIFTKGFGYDKEKLIAFEKALRDARIERFNLVKVSSIFPPKAKIGEIEDLEKLKDGEIVFGVLAINYAKNGYFGSSVGFAIPKNKKIHGYLTEYEFKGKDTSKKAEEMAIKLFKTKFPNENIEKSGYVGIYKKAKKNYWNCCITAAIFIL